VTRGFDDVVDALLAASEASGEVTLDAIGEALGTRAASHDDVDAILHALEARGRRVVAPEDGGGEEKLRRVLATARALLAEGGKKPSVAEIAARSGLAEDEVRHALALARVIQR
jgi:hypothetical protein